MTDQDAIHEQMSYLRAIADAPGPRSVVGDAIAALLDAFTATTERDRSLRTIAQKFVADAKRKADALHQRPVMDAHAVASTVGWLQDWAHILDTAFVADSLTQAWVTHVTTALAAHQPSADTSCEWHDSEDGSWHTGCGHIWEFTNDGPTENGCTFCMYCGKPITIPPSALGDTDDGSG